VELRRLSVAASNMMRDAGHGRLNRVGRGRSGAPCHMVDLNGRYRNISRTESGETSRRAGQRMAMSGCAQGGYTQEETRGTRGGGPHAAVCR
jgi:hypothetical protein